MSYAYLASPYSHPNESVREARYEAAMHATKWLLEKKIWVYSPIVHNHAIAVRFGLAFEYKDWHDFDMAMLQSAVRLYILRIDGYSTSVGVAAEKAEAERLGIPWEYL